MLLARHCGRRAAASCVGDLDLVTAVRAPEAIGHAQDRTNALICDLGDVWLVDLAGLRVLLNAAARARRTGAPLTITNCPPIVPRMLALLKLQPALDIQAQPSVFHSLRFTAAPLRRGSGHHARNTTDALRI